MPDKDLREYSRDISALETLLNSLAFRLHTYPEKYALVMSSTPGILTLHLLGMLHVRRIQAYIWFSHYEC